MLIYRALFDNLVLNIHNQADENAANPSFHELFRNQQSLWKDNNKLMQEFFEFMKSRP